MVRMKKSGVVVKNLVETTNDCSILSKYSMVSKHYAEDPFVGHFVEVPSNSKKKIKARSPLINWGYYIRFKAIEWSFEQVRPDQVISLGCGFDTSAFRHTAVNFVEVDFPDVARNKARIIVDKGLLEFDPDRDFWDIETKTQMPAVILRTPRYCLIGGDLRDDKALVDLLNSERIVLKREGSCVGLLNECSLCYLQERDSNRIISSLVNALSDCHSLCYIGYEQIRSDAPDDGFSLVMLKHFQSIGSPLKTFVSREEQMERFTRLGFQDIQVLDMLKFSCNVLPESEVTRVQQLEPFDEFEEYNLLCASYALTIARRINDSRAPNEERRTSESSEGGGDLVPEPIECQLNVEYFDAPYFLHRSGHASTLVNEGKVMIFGGFGCEDEASSHHKRLFDVISFDAQTEQFTKCVVENGLEGRIHSQWVQLREDLYMVCGGRGSPSHAFGNLLIREEATNYFRCEPIETPQVVASCWRHSLTLMKETNKALKVGGRCLEDREDLLFTFNCDSNIWEANAVLGLDSCRHSHGAASLDSNCLLVSGGLSNSENKFMSNQVVVDLRMRSVSSFGVKSLPQLYSHRIHRIDGNLVAILGGISACGANNNAMLVDLRNKAVVNDLHICHSPKSPLMLHNISSEYVPRSRALYVFGGGGNCFSFGTSFNAQSLVLKL